MKLKLGLIKVLIICILSLVIATTVVFAINKSVSEDKSSSNGSESNIIDSLSTVMQNNESVTQATYFENKALTKDEILKLYNQGYGLKDIEKAEKLSIYCGKTPAEVLKVKGKTSLKVIKKSTQYKSKQGAKNSKDMLDDIKNVGDMTSEYENVEEVSKKWGDVKKELGIDENKLPKELKEEGGADDEN